MRSHLVANGKTYCGRKSYSVADANSVCKICAASKASGKWGYVYLLHFESKLHHAQHYLGSTDNLNRRISQHNCQYTDVKIIRAFHQNQIPFVVARIWRYRGIWNCRFAERDFKRKYKNSVELCPICREQKIRDKARLKELNPLG